VLSANGVGWIDGDRIGPYKLLEKIGEGGFGVVYMAGQQTFVLRKVAFKIIKLPSEACNSNGSEAEPYQYWSEARLARKMTRNRNLPWNRILPS
jgi:serine/threonine protein kinase